MKEILFATGNARKIEEANNTLSAFGVVAKPISIEIDEIQHHNSVEIAKAKARAAYVVTHKPVVVSDTTWEIPALGGFPGGYMKDVSAWLDANDWVGLMAQHDDRTIYCHEHVAYFDGDNLQHFMATYKGTLVHEPRGKITASGSIERLVILYGSLTMAEQLEQGALASAGEVLEHWQRFGSWFSELSSKK